MEIVSRVFIVNVVLAALALTTIIVPSPTTNLVSLGAGAALGLWLLVTFARGKRPHQDNS